MAKNFYYLVEITLYDSNLTYMKLQKKIASSRNADFAFEPDILDLLPKELSKGRCLLCLTDISEENNCDRNRCH